MKSSDIEVIVLNQGETIHRRGFDNTGASNFALQNNKLFSDENFVFIKSKMAGVDGQYAVTPLNAKVLYDAYRNNKKVNHSAFSKTVSFVPNYSDAGDVVNELSVYRANVEQGKFISFLNGNAGKKLGAKAKEMSFQRFKRHLWKTVDGKLPVSVGEYTGINHPNPFDESTRVIRSSKGNAYITPNMIDYGTEGTGTTLVNLNLTQYRNSLPTIMNNISATGNYSLDDMRLLKYFTANTQNVSSKAMENFYTSHQITGGHGFTMGASRTTASNSFTLSPEALQGAGMDGVKHFIDNSASGKINVFNDKYKNAFVNAGEGLEAFQAIEMNLEKAASMGLNTQVDFGFGMKGGINFIDGKGKTVASYAPNTINRNAFNQHYLYFEKRLREIIPRTTLPETFEKLNAIIGGENALNFTEAQAKVREVLADVDADRQAIIGSYGALDKLTHESAFDFLESKPDAPGMEHLVSYITNRVMAGQSFFTQGDVGKQSANAGDKRMGLHPASMHDGFYMNAVGQRAAQSGDMYSDLILNGHNISRDIYGWTQDMGDNINYNSAHRDELLGMMKATVSDDNLDFFSRYRKVVEANSIYAWQDSNLFSTQSLMENVSMNKKSMTVAFNSIDAKKIMDSELSQKIMDIQSGQSGIDALSSTDKEDILRSMLGEGTYSKYQNIVAGDVSADINNIGQPISKLKANSDDRSIISAYQEAQSNFIEYVNNNFDHMDPSSGQINLIGGDVMLDSFFRPISGSNAAAVTGATFTNRGINFDITGLILPDEGSKIMNDLTKATVLGNRHLIKVDDDIVHGVINTKPFNKNRGFIGTFMSSYLRTMYMNAYLYGGGAQGVSDLNSHLAGGTVNVGSAEPRNILDVLNVSFEANDNGLLFSDKNMIDALRKTHEAGDISATNTFYANMERSFNQHINQVLGRNVSDVDSHFLALQMISHLDEMYEGFQAKHLGGKGQIKKRNAKLSVSDVLVGDAGESVQRMNNVEDLETAYLFFKPMHSMFESKARKTEEGLMFGRLSSLVLGEQGNTYISDFIDDVIVNKNRRNFTKLASILNTSNLSAEDVRSMADAEYDIRKINAGDAMLRTPGKTTMKSLEDIVGNSLLGDLLGENLAERGNSVVVKGFDQGFVNSIDDVLKRGEGSYSAKATEDIKKLFNIGGEKKNVGDLVLDTQNKITDALNAIASNDDKALKAIKFKSIANRTVRESMDEISTKAFGAAGLQTAEEIDKLKEYMEHVANLGNLLGKPNADVKTILGELGDFTSKMGGELPIYIARLSDSNTGELMSNSSINKLENIISAEYRIKEAKMKVDSIEAKKSNLDLLSDWISKKTKMDPKKVRLKLKAKLAGMNNKDLINALNSYGIDGLEGDYSTMSSFLLNKLGTEKKGNLASKLQEGDSEALSNYTTLKTNLENARMNNDIPLYNRYLEKMGDYEGRIDRLFSQTYSSEPTEKLMKFLSGRDSVKGTLEAIADDRDLLILMTGKGFTEPQVRSVLNRKKAELSSAKGSLMRTIATNKDSYLDALGKKGELMRSTSARLENSFAFSPMEKTFMFDSLMVDELKNIRGLTDEVAQAERLNDFDKATKLIFGDELGGQVSKLSLGYINGQDESLGKLQEYFRNTSGYVIGTKEQYDRAGLTKYFMNMDGSYSRQSYGMLSRNPHQYLGSIQATRYIMLDDEYKNLSFLKSFTNKVGSYKGSQTAFGLLGLMSAINAKGDHDGDNFQGVLFNQYIDDFGKQGFGKNGAAKVGYIKKKMELQHLLYNVDNLEEIISSGTDDDILKRITSLARNVELDENNLFRAGHDVSSYKDFDVMKSVGSQYHLFKHYKELMVNEVNDEVKKHAKLNTYDIRTGDTINGHTEKEIFDLISDAMKGGDKEFLARAMYSTASVEDLIKELELNHYEGSEGIIKKLKTYSEDVDFKFDKFKEIIFDENFKINNLDLAGIVSNFKKYSGVSKTGIVHDAITRYRDVANTFSSDKKINRLMSQIKSMSGEAFTDEIKGKWLTMAKDIRDVAGYGEFATLVESLAISSKLSVGKDTNGYLRAVQALDEVDFQGNVVSTSRNIIGSINSKNKAYLDLFGIESSRDFIDKVILNLGESNDITSVSNFASYFFDPFIKDGKMDFDDQAVMFNRLRAFYSTVGMSGLKRIVNQDLLKIGAPDGYDIAKSAFSGATGERVSFVDRVKNFFSPLPSARHEMPLLGRFSKIANKAIKNRIDLNAYAEQEVAVYSYGDGMTTPSVTAEADIIEDLANQTIAQYEADAGDVIRSPRPAPFDVPAYDQGTLDFTARPQPIPDVVEEAVTPVRKKRGRPKKFNGISDEMYEKFSEFKQDYGNYPKGGLIRNITESGILPDGAELIDAKAHNITEVKRGKTGKRYYTKTLEKTPIGAILYKDKDGNFQLHDSLTFQDGEWFDPEIDGVFDDIVEEVQPKIVAKSETFTIPDVNVYEPIEPVIEPFGSYPNPYDAGVEKGEEFSERVKELRETINASKASVEDAIEEIDPAEEMEEVERLVNEGWENHNKNNPKAQKEYDEFVRMDWGNYDAYEETAQKVEAAASEAAAEEAAKATQKAKAMVEDIGEGVKDALNKMSSKHKVIAISGAAILSGSILYGINRNRPVLDVGVSHADYEEEKGSIYRSLNSDFEINTNRRGIY